jgi:nucleoid DNA-binding protein
MAKNSKPMSKTEIYKALAERTGLNRKQIAGVFEELSGLIRSNLGRNGPEAFTIPGLLKIVVQHKKATKEREGIDPFTKQPRIFAAKPARKVVKARPLKALKDMV